MSSSLSVVGFSAVVPRRPSVLILGSMPGQASLAVQEYYAHPRNDFWRIMLQLLGQETSPLPAYAVRRKMIMRAGVALWDVYAACDRRGSLDSAIVAGSGELNDIGGLLARYPSIRAVAINGGAATRVFRRHWSEVNARVFFLPSTSPANARMNTANKLAAWRVVAPYLMC